MDKQKILIGGVIFLSLVVLLVIVGKIFMKPTGGATSLSPTEVMDEPIPTIDSSVMVELKQQTGSHDVVLSMSDLPKGTESIDYELSYETVKQGLQGVIGTIVVTDEKSYEKKLTLGTCSSGACVYHEVDGAIKLNLKFTGSFGEKIFEKEYEL